MDRVSSQTKVLLGVVFRPRLDNNCRAVAASSQVSPAVLMKALLDSGGVVRFCFARRSHGSAAAGHAASR